MNTPNHESLFEIPDDLRQEMMACAVQKQVPLDWLINLYRRGFNAKIGATGNFPLNLGPSNEGELSMAVGIDPRNGVIRMVFGKPVEWLALPASHARRMARLLLKKADELEHHFH